MSMHVFTYGSLMFGRVWRRVVGVENTKAEAMLYGYKRTKIKNEVYPALIPGTASDCVLGQVYMNVEKRGLDKLDRFEGKYYRRRVVSCEMVDEKSISAWVYVFRSLYAYRVIDEPWDPTWFADEGIHRFIAEYKGLHPNRTGV